MRHTHPSLLLPLVALACAAQMTPAPVALDPVNGSETTAGPVTADPRPASEETVPDIAKTPIADHYRATANKIIDAALADGDAYKKLAHLTDRIGARLSGSKSLEKAVTWAAAAMKADGHENVHTEKVMVPHWVRGQESARIVSPVVHNFHILALGGSIGTPKRGVTAEVVVVESFEELAALGDKVKGKIVLFNKAMPAYNGENGAGYGATVRYRTRGAVAAAKQGAVAALVRSVTAHSLRTPHTGAMRYDEKVKKIPSAAVSIEDAELLARLVTSGDPIRVNLKLGARTLADKPSANVIGELRGSEKPEEIVVIGGHLDSWDVGQGAHDDATGCVMAMHALTVLRKLGLRPRRTIRVVLFTNEENGLRGGRAYAEQHKAELANHIAAIESDGGGFKPIGYSIQTRDEKHPALAHGKDITSLLERIEANSFKRGYGGADISPMGPAGVPMLGHVVDMSKYFDYHHSNADTLDKVDPTHFRMNVAAMAVMAYVIADMPDRFGR